jgi:hypothetical protein
MFIPRSLEVRGHIIKPNARVTIRTQWGQVTGRANPMLFFDSHCVIDVGHGSPRVADADNIIAINGKAIPPC